MAEVTVSAGTIDGYAGDFTALKMRIYASHTFTPSDGEPIIGGRVRRGDFYKEIDCTAADEQITYPQFTIDPTEDAIDPGPTIPTYTFALFTDSDALLMVLYDDIHVPIQPDPTTLPDLVTYSALFEGEQPAEPLNITSTWGQIIGDILDQADLIALLHETLVSSLQVFPIPCSDRTTPIATADNIASWLVPADLLVTEVQASLVDAAATGTFTVDLKLDGDSILSTPLTIDAGEKTSINAAIAAVLSQDYWAKGSELIVDVTDDADGTASGLLVTVLGTSVWDTEAPTIPGTPTYSGVTQSKITVSWSPSADDIAVAGYILQRATDAGFTANVVTTTLGNVTSLEVTGLLDETTYYFRVRAFDHANNRSAYSTVSSQATVAAITIESLIDDVYRWYNPAGLLSLGLNNSDPILTEWPDSSNENVGATSAGGAASPLFKTNIINGLPAVLCAQGGVSDINTLFFSTMGDLSALVQGEAFIVIKPSSETPGGPSGVNGIWTLSAFSTFYPYPPSNQIKDSFGTSTAEHNTPKGADDLSDAFHIYSVYSASADWANFLDGVELFQTNVNTVVFPSSNTALGRNYSSSGNLDGYIAEFVLFSRKLADLEREGIVIELKTKYNLP